MRYVCISEFRKHFTYYLNLSSKEDIYLTKRGKVVAVLTKPNEADVRYYETLHHLEGILADYDTGEDYDTMIGNEIMRRCGF